MFSNPRPELPPSVTMNESTTRLRRSLQMSRWSPWAPQKSVRPIWCRTPPTSSCVRILPAVLLVCGFSSSRGDGAEWMKRGGAAIILQQREGSRKNTLGRVLSMMRTGRAVSTAIHQFIIEKQSDGSACNKVAWCPDQSNGWIQGQCWRFAGARSAFTFRRFLKAEPGSTSA